jgi:hypothetical protein
MKSLLRRLFLFPDMEFVLTFPQPIKITRAVFTKQFFFNEKER